MTKLDQAVRRIARLTAAAEQNQWEIADELSLLSAEDYETALPKLVTETKWSRNVLTMMRTTALAWPPERRLADVPYHMHQRYRYNVKELMSQHRRGKLGVVSKPTAKRLWTLNTLASAVASVLEMADDPRISDKTFRKNVSEILAKWNRPSKAA